MTRRPNFLIVMVDQLNGTLFPDGPADFLHAPHLKALASRSARFASNYTASPLCAPGRASFMSGQLPSRTQVYDNAAEFASDIPTFAQGAHPSVLGRRHVPWESDVVVTCGGAAVCPGDVIVGDGDGVIVIPRRLADEVVTQAAEQEQRDAWIADRVAEGESIDGLFPMNAAWRERYERETGAGE